jgi:sugar phosphate isomerase/epimerase
MIDNFLRQRIAVSSWSIHHALGITYTSGPGLPHSSVAAESFGPAQISIYDLPQVLATRGFHRLELCHFHLASQNIGYLNMLREAFAQSDVVIQTLLIDDGDITNPDLCDRDMKWIADWIEAAAHLGAENVRVIAGKAAPTPENLKLSVDGLKRLTGIGAQHGVRVVTENWFDTLSTPDAVHQVLDAVGPSLGFLADTGNWFGPTKYSDLQSVFGRAELCHAKTSFASGLMLDEDDNLGWLKAAQKANYKGPYTLIFADAGDEWEGLDIEREFIVRHSLA